MNRRQLRRILILLIAAAICLEMARYAGTRPARGSGTLSLWYQEADFPAAAMDALLARCRLQTGLRVEGRGFADERSLGEAFEEERPDLLLCTHARAAELAGRGGLAALSEPLPVPGLLESAGPMIGESFFPIGGRLPLLLIHAGLTVENFASLEALLTGVRKGPFLAVDDLSELLYASMLSKGGEMSGDAEKDAENPAFRALYNAVATAAYQGILVPMEENAAEYVRQGILPCAVTSSAALAEIRSEKLRFRPLPLPKGGSIVYAAELLGFVLPEGARADTAGVFLRWLWEDTGAGETVLDAGLVPVSQARDYSGAGGLRGVLSELSQSGRLVFPDADEAFFRNRAACEERLRTALDLLG